MSSLNTQSTLRLNTEHGIQRTDKNQHGVEFSSENSSLAGASLSPVPAASGKTSDFSHLTGGEAKKDKPSTADKHGF